MIHLSQSHLITLCKTTFEKTAKCMVCRVLMQDRSFAMPKIELKLL